MPRHTLTAMKNTPPPRIDASAARKALSREETATQAEPSPEPRHASHASSASEALAPAERLSWKTMWCCVGGGAVLGIPLAGALPLGVVVDAVAYKVILAVIGAVAGAIVGSVISYPAGQSRPSAEEIRVPANRPSITA